MQKDKKPARSRYEGKYVATASFNDRKVLACGRDPVAVRARAQGKGIASPVITYVPRGDAFNIF
ncbi:MAG: hypothetical protein IH624_18280 [Phycisphaerae bacterium]|nr:hypothetical protein [Phycisphaerae bacterium]